MMRSLVLICLLSGPAYAQDAEAEGDMRQGLDLLSEGTRLLMEGLSSQLGPALEGLRDRLGDLDAYHAPELLPNGDIIIRRKTPLEEDVEIPEGGLEL